jgi:hypothetical protein
VEDITPGYILKHRSFSHRRRRRRMRLKEDEAEGG